MAKGKLLGRDAILAVQDIQTEAVEVPAAGSLTLRVDLATRTASLEGQSPGSVETVETAEAPPGEEVAHVEDPPPAPPPPAPAAPQGG